MIRVTIDTSVFDRKIANLKDQVPFATALALTRTAQQIAREDLPAEMREAFKAPSRYTLGAFRAIRATKDNLVATITTKTGGKSDAANWLRPEIYGGGRFTGIEGFLRRLGLPSGMFAVPASGAPTTRGDKVNISALQKIVAELAANPPQEGFKGLTRARRGRGKNSQYFYLLKPQFGLPAGIFQVKGRAVKPLVLFVKQPRYQRRLDLVAVARRAVEARFETEFRSALAQALRTAR